MSRNRGPLVRAFLVGTLWNLLAGVLVPVLVLGTAAALFHRSLTSDLFHVAVWLSAAVLVPLFLLHEAVVLAALLWRLRRPEPPRGRAAADLVNAALGADILAIAGLGVYLTRQGVANLSGSMPLAALLLPALYGVALLAGCLERALPGAEEAPAGRRHWWGLRVYVAVVVALLAVGLAGGVPGTGVGPVVAVLSVIGGHLAARLANRLVDPEPS